MEATKGMAGRRLAAWIQQATGKFERYRLTLREQFLRRLGALARRGMVRQPPKRGLGRGPSKPLQLVGCTALQPPLRANFTRSPGAVEQALEALFPQAPQMRATLNRVTEHAARGPQRERPGRSYLRRACRPSEKGRNLQHADPPGAD